ncbi:hypothetical protein [Pseudomonas jilinensis]|uniref:Uncharacterized protein n=1 Tax=Pseudomonas jilinensis TaxID=2078689 RepID=A0A396S059_9PSED|nr:hypothetical protein [Pseudomonas jilinensis]RHW21876.1 hypothetical protein C2846_05280 [Pseudomonas jilinensis]
MWVQIAILVASYLINQATQPKPPKPKPAAFQDFDFPRCDEGTEKEWVFGQVWAKGWMVLAVRNQRSQAIKVKGSKK